MDDSAEDAGVLRRLTVGKGLFKSVTSSSSQLRKVERFRVSWVEEMTCCDNPSAFLFRDRHMVLYRHAVG